MRPAGMNDRTAGAMQSTHLLRLADRVVQMGSSEARLNLEDGVDALCRDQSPRRGLEQFGIEVVVVDDEVDLARLLAVRVDDEGVCLSGRSGDSRGAGGRWRAVELGLQWPLPPYGD